MDGFGSFIPPAFVKEREANDWNVPPDTVVSLTFEPNETLMVGDLKLDKTKYERIVDQHLRSAVYYFNKEEGIRISARILDGDSEDIQDITYEPAAKEYHLRCPNGSKQLPDPAKQGYPGLAFDDSDLTFEHELYAVPSSTSLATTSQR